MENLRDILNIQREFFYSNRTKDENFRIKILKELRDLIKLNENRILESLKMDLGKSNFESYVTEVGFILDEINYTIENLHHWMEPKKEKSSLLHFPSTNYTYYEPLGVTLVISPWNYPFQLAFGPLDEAVGAGNTVILKTSKKSKYTSRLIKDFFDRNFPKEIIYVVDGDKVSNEDLLKEKYDHIFFTGSTIVGKKIMEAGAKHLSKVTLELGGKSPCIVDESADINLSAKRIAWGKLINSGQTCVAPDFIVVHEDKKEEFLKSLKNSIIDFYSEDQINNRDYPRIINKEHFDRLINLLEDQDIFYGGAYNSQDLKIQPTIVDNVDFSNKLMEEEIFGPIFPILTYGDLDILIMNLKRMPKPLALYYFTLRNKNADKVIREVSFGGGCINDTIVHLANPHLEFGGVGESGTGGYHGKYGFMNFSNRKSILKKSKVVDIDLRYPPFNKKLKLIKKVMK